MFELFLKYQWFIITIQLIYNCVVHFLFELSESLSFNSPKDLYFIPKRSLFKLKFLMLWSQSFLVETHTVVLVNLFRFIDLLCWFLPFFWRSHYSEWVPYSVTLLHAPPCPWNNRRLAPSTKIWN
jgi:hypothetical protein